LGPVRLRPSSASASAPGSTTVEEELVLPALSSGSIIVVGIWVGRPEAAESGDDVTLQVALHTVEKEWLRTRELHLGGPDAPVKTRSTATVNSKTPSSWDLTAIPRRAKPSIGGLRIDGRRTPQTAGPSPHTLTKRIQRLGDVDIDYDHLHQPRHRRPGPVAE
jgi:hypothetical protein